jgi:putative addiction module antidote
VQKEEFRHRVAAPYVITFVETEQATGAFFRLKLTTIGNSVGVVLPKDALACMHLQKGDEIYLTESPEGYRLTPYSPEVRRADDAGPSNHEGAAACAQRARQVNSWRWVDEDIVLATHDEQLAEHGGAPGLSGAELLQSALARPQKLAARKPQPRASIYPPMML